MKTVSLLEAKRFFDEKHPNYFLFSTEKQQSEKISCGSLYLLSKFKSMIVSTFTNRICFVEGDNKLCFSGIRKIQIEDAGDSVLFCITCRMFGKDVTYRIVAY